MNNNGKCLDDLLFGVPQVNLSSIDVPPEVASLIPVSLAERYHVVPIRKEGKRLTLAMVDPTNMFAVDDVRLASGCHVDVVMASECDIKQIIEQSYGVNDLVQKAVKQVIKEERVPLVEETADDTPVISIVNSIISEAVKDLASDIHIEPLENRVRIRYRIDGILRQVLELPLYLHAALISRIKIMSDMDIAEKRIPQDGRITVTESDRQIDVRVSTLPTISGEKLAMRILDKAVIRLAIQELGFSNKNFSYYEKLYRQPYGMILITGPTGLDM
jgi:type IV pilus assembly protein PilB